MLGPFRSSVIRGSVTFEVRSFKVRSNSRLSHSRLGHLRFGLSTFSLLRFGLSRFGQSRFGHGFPHGHKHGHGRRAQRHGHRNSAKVLSLSCYYMYRDITRYIASLRRIVIRGITQNNAKLTTLAKTTLTFAQAKKQTLTVSPHGKRWHFFIKVHKFFKCHQPSVKFLGLLKRQDKFYFRDIHWIQHLKTYFNIFLMYVYVARRRAGGIILRG
jgi:hypothetical protein